MIDNYLPPQVEAVDYSEMPFRTNEEEMQEWDLKKKPFAMYVPDKCVTGHTVRKKRYFFARS